MIERDMDVITQKKYSRIICNQTNIKSKLARKKVVICCSGNILTKKKTVITTRGQNICLFSSYFSVVSNCITL